MYKAFNKYIIVTSPFNDDFKTQVLAGEVVSTTKDTEKLLGKTIIAPRHKILELGETEEDRKTDTGIILGSKNKYAAVNIDDIIAIKHD